ncbi:MAG: hypothetical protein IKV85_02130 [Ruminococcus sp.]|nr:hypothetical protein [Ruminococcus sp.]
MPMYETDDMVDKKKREKRKKNLIRLGVGLAIVAVGGIIYATNELWMPKIRGLGKQYTTIVNDGKLAKGNFPIEITDSESYRMECADNILCVLSDANIYMYSNEGGLIKKRQHAYSNAIMNTAGERVLIYESGGYRFSVEDRNDIVYTKSFTENIMFVRMSEEGYTAVVTTPQDYDCKITVFDHDGKEIYERKCVERVSDICFTEDSEGCVVSYIYAENGSLATSVQEISFTEEKEKWTSAGLDTAGIQVCGFSGGASVVGMDACGYVDEGGNIISMYHYNGDFVEGSCENGKAAVAINSDETREYTAALFDDGGKEPLELNFESPLIDITVQDGLAYIMTENSIEAYDFSGGLRSTAQISDSYTGFVRADGYVYLKGFEKIDRINYES